MMNTLIEWAHHTFNPWRGCTPLSEACANCYAETYSTVRRGLDNWGPGKPRIPASAGTLSQPYAWARDAAARSQIARVFTLSHGDIYDTDKVQRGALDAMRERLFETMRGTLAEPARDGAPAKGGLYWIALSKRKKSLMPADLRGHPCVVQGFTAENQDWLDRRWAALEAQGASYHVFVSVEPWVGPIRSLPPSLAALGKRVVMVLGGENCTLVRQTPHALPVAEALYLRDLCAEAGINFFFKQWGSIGPDGVRRRKKENGRLLEGRLHDAFPAPPIDGLKWLTPETEPVS